MYTNSHYTRGYIEQYSAKSEWWTNASGAFFGAFFAFLFGLVAYFVQKKFDRYHKHKNAVVELEYLLQEHFDISAANQFLLEEAIKTISGNVLPFTLLSEFRIPSDLPLRLGELALINRFADYQVTAGRMSHSMQTWQKISEKLHDATVAGALTNEAQKSNLSHLANQAAILVKFLRGLDEDTRYLVAYVRVFMRKDKNIWSIKWLQWKNKIDDGEDLVTDGDVENEIKKMQKEVREIQKRSKKKIEKLLNK